MEFAMVESVIKRAKLTPLSQPDHAPLHSIPPLRIMLWLTREFSKEAVVEDTYPKVHDMELVPTLTKQNSLG